jgi:hypothetical protein
VLFDHLNVPPLFRQAMAALEELLGNRERAVEAVLASPWHLASRASAIRRNMATLVELLGTESAQAAAVRNPQVPLLNPQTLTVVACWFSTQEQQGVKEVRRCVTRVQPTGASPTSRND